MKLLSGFSITKQVLCLHNTGSPSSLWVLSDGLRLRIEDCGLQEEGGDLNGGKDGKGGEGRT